MSDTQQRRPSSGTLLDAFSNHIDTLQNQAIALTSKVAKNVTKKEEQEERRGLPMPKHFSEHKRDSFSSFANSSFCDDLLTVDSKHDDLADSDDEKQKYGSAMFGRLTNLVGSSSNLRSLNAAKPAEQQGTNTKPALRRSFGSFTRANSFRNIFGGDSSHGEGSSGTSLLDSKLSNHSIDSDEETVISSGSAPKLGASKRDTKSSKSSNEKDARDFKPRSSEPQRRPPGRSQSGRQSRRSRATGIRQRQSIRRTKSSCGDDRILDGPAFHRTRTTGGMQDLSNRPPSESVTRNSMWTPAARREDNKEDRSPVRRAPVRRVSRKNLMRDTDPRRNSRPSRSRSGGDGLRSMRRGGSHHAPQRSRSGDLRSLRRSATADNAPKRLNRSSSSSGLAAEQKLNRSSSSSALTGAASAIANPIASCGWDAAVGVEDLSDFEASIASGLDLEASVASNREQEEQSPSKENRSSSRSTHRRGSGTSMLGEDEEEEEEDPLAMNTNFWAEGAKKVEVLCDEDKAKALCNEDKDIVREFERTPPTRQRSKTHRRSKSGDDSRKTSGDARERAPPQRQRSTRSSARRSGKSGDDSDDARERAPPQRQRSRKSSARRSSKPEEEEDVVERAPRSSKSSDDARERALPQRQRSSKSSARRTGKSEDAEDVVERAPPQRQRSSRSAARCSSNKEEDSDDARERAPAPQNRRPNRVLRRTMSIDDAMSPWKAHDTSAVERAPPQRSRSNRDSILRRTKSGDGTTTRRPRNSRSKQELNEMNDLQLGEPDTTATFEFKRRASRSSGLRRTKSGDDTMLRRPRRKASDPSMLGDNTTDSNVDDSAPNAVFEMKRALPQRRLSKRSSSRAILSVERPGLRSLRRTSTDDSAGPPRPPIRRCMSARGLGSTKYTGQDMPRPAGTPVGRLAALTPMAA